MDDISLVRRAAFQNLAKHVRQLQYQTQAEIRAHLNVRLTREEQERLTRLQERCKEREPTAEDLEERQELFDRIEAVATEKAAALWLLSGKSLEEVEALARQLKA